MNTANRRHTYRRPITGLLAVLLLTFSSFALSQNDNRFHIDLVVFANNDQSSRYEEDWPDNLHLRYPRNWTRIYNSGTTLQKVDYMDPEFEQTLKSLRLSSRYKPLLQASWQQDLTSRKRSPAILIQGGKQYGNHYELEGYIRVAVERYLHVDTNLWLSSFGSRGGNYYLPRQPLSFDEPEELPSPASDSPEYAEFLKQNPGYTPQAVQAKAEAESRGDYPIDQIVVMKQQRRMRSDELHFIDHPRFGVIIKISKIKEGTGVTEASAENAAQ